MPTIDDLCRHINFDTACTMVGWFGGTTIYIPTKATQDHPMSALLGHAAFKALVGFADKNLSETGRVMNIPSNYHMEIARRNRMICALAEEGRSTRDIARMAMLTERQVQNIRRRLEDEGLLPLILREAKPTDGVSEMRQSVRNSTPGTPCG